MIKKYWIYIILCIFLLPAVYPLLRLDFFHFSDEPNISLIYEMSRALKALHFPPRWIPDVSYNYGHPLFNFYYPLPFMLGALIFQLTGSLISSIKLYFLLTVIVSSLAMYHLLKKHTTSFMAFVGALIYVYTPYRAVDLYVRGAIGELTAFAVVPIVCIFIFKLFEKPNFKNVSILSLVLALFILSHNLALMIFFPWFLVYAFYLYLKKKNNKKLVLYFGLAVTFGILISAYWLFPAISEKHLLFSQTPFDYKDHFPFLKQLVYSPFKYGASQPGPYDDISLQVGIANILLVFVAVKSLITSDKNKKILPFFSLSAFAFSIFLMNIRSSFLWEAFSLSTYFQFPWRILMFTTFLTAFMIVFLKSHLLGLILLIIAFINTVGYFVPSEYFKPGDDYYMRRMFANRVISGKAGLSEAYKNYSEDYLLLPKWVEKKPVSVPQAKIESTTAKINSIMEISPYEYLVDLIAGEQAQITVNNFYYPGWNIYIDGLKTDTFVLKPYGNIGFMLSEGKHQIKVIWEETVQRKIVNYISFTSLIIVVSLLFTSKNIFKDK